MNDTKLSLIDVSQTFMSARKVSKSIYTAIVM